MVCTTEILIDYSFIVLLDANRQQTEALAGLRFARSENNSATWAILATNGWMPNLLGQVPSQHEWEKMEQNRNGYFPLFGHNTCVK